MSKKEIPREKGRTGLPAPVPAAVFPAIALWLISAMLFGPAMLGGGRQLHSFP